ncbi:MAG: hypothetical protein KBD78_03890 [Oligoflexales bacterium]|nr:hypothetical protein [Oligoflexales bacterium]
MSIQTAKLYKETTAVQRVWNTTLDASDTTPKEPKGSVRWTFDPVFGYRGFQYVRFDQSGGATKDNICSYRGLVSVSASGAGSTTTIVTSGLTANILADGIIACLDDAGAAGAAPEGENARVVSNSATLITIDSNDAFSAATASSDTFRVHLPWAVIDAASGDTAAAVAGVVMVTQPQYSWGWVQFAGFHPTVSAVAAGTTITANRDLIASTNVVTNGSTSAVELRVGYTPFQLTTDTVIRKVGMYINCGFAKKVAASA